MTYTECRMPCLNVRGCFPFPFDGFGPAHVRKLAGVVWPVVRPVVRIDLAEHRGEGKERFRRTVCTLDEAQARLASNLGTTSPCRTHPSAVLFPEESIPHGDPPQRGPAHSARSGPA